MFTRLMSLGVVGALVGSVLLVGHGAAATASCAPASGGGDWPSFGHDLSNTRSQPAEDQISTATAASLLPKWSFSVTGAGGAGGFQSVPVVSDGCVYVGTNAGWVFALNADTGDVVWTQNLASSDLLVGLSGGIFALAVGDGRVYANVSATGSPYSAALDQETGEVLWATVVDRTPGAYTNSSVALIDGMVFIGISGPENGPAGARHPGGFALLDPATGDIIKRVWTVSEAEDARGLKGASLWGTPVYDPDTGYMYDGTGQPANKSREATLSNALIKVDMDRGRDSFGEVVDYYKGQLDERLDVDFGASPNLFTDSNGDLLVGALQKSGVYHAVFADTMDQAWWVRLADASALNNVSTAAVDDTSVYVAAGQRVAANQSASPGTLFALAKDTGAIRWKIPVADGIEYHPITVANGVVYLVTTHGILLGLRATDGVPVLARPMGLDVADACANLSAAVTVARHTVFAHCDTGVRGGGWLVAYASNPAIPALPL